MGQTTAPHTDSSNPELTPLSQQRVIDRLDAQGFVYVVDDDGDLGGVWDDHVFYFLLLGRVGEFLQVRGRWNREVGADEIGSLLDAVNTWNTEKLWPKAYVRVDGTDVGVFAEHVVDYEHGVTDAQLELHLACAITTSLQLFEHLDALYPAAAEASRAAIAALRAQQA
jgi:hypothetical protein